MGAAYVVAEAGVNHNGERDMALALIDAAAQAGADAVKFQTFNADKLAVESAAKADYQKKRGDAAESQLAMLRDLELPLEWHADLQAHAHSRGIEFLSTAFDEVSFSFLVELGVPIVKVPSGELTNGPLLLKFARARRRLFLSTGMADLADIEAALKIIAFGLVRDEEPAGAADFDWTYNSEDGRAALNQHVTILHCVSEYPCPPDHVNLRAMQTIGDTFDLPIGYSDHSLGIAIPIAAVARGATVIEKHLTLDRTLPGPDHAASLEPHELVGMIMGIREIEAALGRPEKCPNENELANRAVARRSLVAARAIRQGETIVPGMIACKRPAGGLSPLRYWDQIGTVSTRDYAVDEPLELP